MSILKEFSFQLEDLGYYRNYSSCCFDKNLVFTDLCHLIPNKKHYNKMLIREFGLDEFLADIVIDLPVINVIPGNKKYNREFYKIGYIDDVTYIDKKIIKAARLSIFNMLKGLNNEFLLNFLVNYVIDDFLYIEENELSNENNVELIKKIHYKYVSYFNLKK